MLYNCLFENRAVFEIKWKSIIEPGRPPMTVRRMRIASWIPEATNTHSEYVIIIACPLQRWLHERISVLRVTYFTCHFKYPDCTIETPTGGRRAFHAVCLVTAGEFKNTSKCSH